MAREGASRRVKIAIAGAGVSGFATLGYLVESLRPLIRTFPSTKVTIYWLQPPRDIQIDNLSVSQRDRLTHLNNRGLDPSRLLGGGLVYHPMQPSLFTFNGNSAARGFNFAARRYDTRDYFEWIQANRDLLAALYPDFAPENDQQLHPDHTLDNIQGTTPRGAYGLYLHDQVLALKAHLAIHFPEHISLQIIPEALRSLKQHKLEQHKLEQNEQTITLKTASRQLSVDYLVEATGPRYGKLRPEWGDCVFRAYPCDRYGQNLPPQVTVIGAGASGIEVALHLLHNLNVEQVTLVSRRAQSRLPQIETTEAYQCQWLTRQNMQQQPTAKNAQTLLQKELKACYQACRLDYPGWDALLNIADYPSFLSDYIETATRAPNHPFAHLVRPVMSFYGQIKDLLPTTEQTGVQQLINRVKPLFATQSRPCAELMLAALKTNRLRLVAGEFLPAQTMPTILQSKGNQIHPNCIILATGFTPLISPCPQARSTHCYQVTGSSLSAVHNQAKSVIKEIISDIPEKLAGCVLNTSHSPSSN